jgi:hypothetical protein
VIQVNFCCYRSCEILFQSIPSALLVVFTMLQPPTCRCRKKKK